MGDFRDECEAVWHALESAREGMPVSTFCKKMGIEVRNYHRWAKKGRVGTGRIEDVKTALQSQAIDWKQHTREGSVYRFQLSYEANVNEGPPKLPPKIPERATSQSIQLFGRKVASPIGVSASVATANSTWIEFWSNLHFDVITYKTVRLVNRTWPPHTAPNIIRLSGGLSLASTEDSIPEIVLSADSEMVDAHDHNASLANSVGIPSPPSSIWEQDVRKARGVLREDQFLIVSVVGTGETESEMIRNFADCATLAAESGADAVELNLSCPNIIASKLERREGSLYKHPQSVKKLLTDVRKNLKDHPLIIKIGVLADDELEGIVKAANGLVNGYTAINTVQCSVLRNVATPGADPTPVFSRPEASSLAGVSGAAIKENALRMVRNLGHLRKHKDDFTILGVGGVMRAKDFSVFLEAGADVVQCCTGALLNRFLGIQAQNEIQRTPLSLHPRTAREGILSAAERARYRMVASFKPFVGAVCQAAVAADLSNVSVSQLEDIALFEIKKREVESQGLAVGSRRRFQNPQPTQQYWMDMLRARLRGQ